MKMGQRVIHFCKRERTLSILLSLVLLVTFVAVPLMTVSANPAPAGGVPTFGGFIGSNSFFNENQATYEIFGNIREYHPLGFTEWTAGWGYEDGNGNTSNSLLSMNPQATFMNTWGVFDNYYKTMFDKGIELTLCVTGTEGGRVRPDYQDPDGTRSTMSASYLGHAQSMFQLAARYGSNKDVDPNLVRVAVGTEKKIGLGYVKYFENFNEPNLNGFNGAQFAAMLSADYDGHMGTMGPGVGVKAADPNAKVVMGGIAGVMYNSTLYGNKDNDDRQFLQDMLAWFDANRTLEQWKAAHGGSEAGYEKYPFDVLSCHAYCTDGYSTGVSPEQDHLFEVVSDYVRYCNTMFPGKEVYLSEFGWDTAQDGYSVFRANVSGAVNAGLTGAEVQGRWLVREYLMLAAAGIDRARQFMIPDTSDNPYNPNWFATCGLVYGIQGSANYKPSWYYIGAMNNILQDTSLKDIEIVADGGRAATGMETGGPWALKFSSVKNTDQIYALWLPTSLGDQGGANTRDYTVTVPAGYTHATLVTLKDKVKWGECDDISDRIAGGQVTVSISEKPVFVILSKDEYYNPVYDFIHPCNFSTWTLTPDSGDPTLLFDEQRTDTSTNPAPNMQNAWSPGGMNRYAVVDLYAKYNLSNLYVYDREGALAAGKVLAVYAYTGGGTPDLLPNSMTGAQVQIMLAGSDWERVAWHDFAKWDIWDEAVVDVETRYLALGFEDGPSTFYDNPWPVDWLPVPEMVIKGALAKGETPPPDPPPVPDPPPRVFESKPSEAEYRFLFDNDFEDGLIKGGTNGGIFTVIDSQSAYGTGGKLLKVESAAAQRGFTIPASALASVEPGRWYYVDYKFMTESADMAPELYLRPFGQRGDFYVYGRMGGNLFKPFWSFDSDIIAVKPDEWHHLKAKFMIDADDNVNYEVFYDGDLISARSMIYKESLPKDGLTLYMTSDQSTGVYYYDDVWVYTRISSDTILNATFDKQPLRKLKSGDDGLHMRPGQYAQDSEIVQPDPADPFYLGAGDQLLKVTSRSWLFDTNGSDTLQEIKVGEDYVFELSFYYKDAGDGLTKTPYFMFLYNDWMLHTFANTDWYGGLWVRDQNGYAANIKPMAGQWHRYVIKYRFDTVSQITYSFYYDDLTAPVATVTLDANIPGQMDNHFDDLVSSMGIMVGCEGFSLTDYPLYINDVLLYRGNIRPWPDKYTGVITAKYEVTVTSEGSGADGGGWYAEGETVAIYAGSRPGYTFAGWATADGVIFADAGAAATTFAMPAKNVAVTARWNPVSTGYILNATFDRLPLGTFKDGDDDLTLLTAGYTLNNTIVQSKSSDAFYLETADQLLRVSTASGVFETSGKKITDQYKVGEDYVFEMSFYATTWQTTPCLSFRYGQWAWEYDYFTLTDWHGGMVAYDQNGGEVSVIPEPGRWHRYAVKFRFETQNNLTYSFYYDDMTKPVVTGTRDAVVGYGIKNLIGNLGFTVGLWNVGVNMNTYPLYINDVLIYSGDIRPWPGKYTSG